MRVIRRGRHEAPAPYGLFAAVAPPPAPASKPLWASVGKSREFRQPSHRTHLPQKPPSDPHARIAHRSGGGFLRSSRLRGAFGVWLFMAFCDIRSLREACRLRFSSPRNYRFGGHRCYILSQYGIKRVTTDATDVICGIKFGLCQTINLLSVKRLSAYV